MLKFAVAQSIDTLALSTPCLTYRGSLKPVPIRMRTPTITQVALRYHPLVMPLSSQETARKLLLLMAVTFVGLAYALVLPLAGLFTLAWIAGGAYWPRSRTGK
jgi:hypothetical protein